MLIKATDEKGYLPVHPRLALSNLFRSFGDRTTPAMREKRKMVDRLTAELIPVYESRKGLEMSQPKHEHEIVMVGMVNVNRDNYLQGTVDVWRCRGCRKLFCDDKRYGEPLKPSVGFEEIGEDEQWAILTCTDIKEVFMMSLGVKPGRRSRTRARTGPSTSSW